jgi:hypothetical protein
MRVLKGCLHSNRRTKIEGVNQSQDPSGLGYIVSRIEVRVPYQAVVLADIVHDQSES